MNRQSAKEMFFGNPSEIIKDGKLTFKPSNESGDLKKMSVSTGDAHTFTPRPKRTPTKVKNPEPKQSVNNSTTTKSLGKSSKFNLPEELLLTFTAGTVDLSFPYGDGYGFDNNVHDFKIQSDGKIIVVGDFNNYEYSGDTYFSPYICRLNDDGTFDDTFDVGDSFNNAVITIHLQEDGKIIVGGDFTYYDRDLGYGCNYIARLNPDGSFDTTYNIGDGFNGAVYKIEVQLDGKTVIGGQFDQYNNANHWRIVRLNNSGGVDPSFNTGDGFNWDIIGYVNEIKQQPDGKLLVGGFFESYDGVTVNNIARLNSNGTLDTSFLTGIGFSDEVTSIVLQSDNKIIVGGYFDTYDNNYLYGGHIVRLNAIGELDTRFGYGLDAAVLTLTIQSDDKILVGGFQTEFYDDISSTINCNKLIRFHSNCTLDYSFYFENFLSQGVYAITLLDDGKILIGGEFDTNGDPSAYFINHFGKINNVILEYPYVAKMIDCALSTGGMIDNYQDYTYIVGSKVPIDFNKVYSFYDIYYPSHIFCGSFIDEFPSVNLEYIQINEYDDCMLALEDNSKLVALEPYLGDYPYSPNLLVDKRYNIGDYLFYSNLFVTEGEAVYFHGTFQITEELPFNNSNTFDKIVTYDPYENGEESIEANGQYIVSQDCVSDNYLLSLSYQESNLQKTVAQSDNDSPCKFNFFPCSFFSPYFGFIISYENLSGGTPVLNSTLEFNSRLECLAEMSNFGIQNTSFNDGGFSGGFEDGPMVFTSLEQPDGKILVAGDFYEYDGTTVNSLMRIDSEGDIDNTFFQGGLNGYVKVLALQPDGKILVGGDFSEYDGVSYNNLVRLNPDGTYDGTFNIGLGFDNRVRAIALQHDGKIIVGGDFNNFDDEFYVGKIARLNTDGSIDLSFNTGDGFDARVFTIIVERNKRPTEFYYTGGEVIYDETIIVGGQFEGYNNTTIGAIARLDSDGNLLSSFGEGFTSYNRVFKVERLTDGKLLIAGGFSRYRDVETPYGIVRLNPDYSVDTTFNIPTWDSIDGGFNDWVVNFEVLPNNKIMVGGQFNVFTDNDGEHNTGSLVRLNSDGSLDDSFTFQITGDHVNKITYLQNKTILVGGWFDSPSDKLTNIFIGGEYELRDFETCDGVDSYIYVSTNDVNLSTVVKANFNDTPAVCGNIGNVVYVATPIGGTGIGGSMYFDGNNNTMVQIDNSGGQFGFNGTNDLTIEWFQYFEGGSNARPFSIGVYNNPNEMIGMSFEGTVYLWINNSGIDTSITNDDLLNGWHHIAITRYYDGANHIWRVFLDGVLKNTTINNTNTSNTDTLTIGNQLNNDGRFQGYITNFRINNLSALYTSNFTVSTIPLTCISNILLLITSTNEGNLTTDVCGESSISSTGVTWSSLNPFSNTLLFYKNTDVTEYTNCDDCDTTVDYKATLYVRDGVSPDRVQYSYMKKSDIDKMLSTTPIATINGVECYELLKYYL